MIDRESKRRRSDNGINDPFAETAAEVALVGGIHVAMKDAGYVVAIIDTNEFAAERITVAMFEENLFAGMVAGGVEIHCDIFAVKRERGERDALGGLRLGNLDRGRIFNDFGGIAEGLFRIPELQAAQLRRAFDRDEGSGIDPRCERRCRQVEVSRDVSCRARRVHARR